MELNLHFDTDKLTNEQIQKLAKNAMDYAMLNGILFPSKQSLRLAQPAPFLLFPTPFPKKLFDRTKEVQQDFNLLVHKVSQDHEFLKEFLQGTIIADEFVRRIFNIYEQTRKEGIAQPISLGLLRLDYMLESDKDAVVSIEECNENMAIKQVEINTIAVGSILPAVKLPGLCSYVLGLINKDVAVGSTQMPVNSALTGIAEGLAQAWEFYGSKSAVIMMITFDDDGAKFEQKALEYYLHHRNTRIKMIRRSLPELHEKASLDSKKLMVDGNEIAVAYYRSGYTPRDYPNEGTWAARLLVERSLAIKCPTAGLHLVTTKKIQQVLAQPGVLERFISDSDALKRIRSTFTGLYTLDKGPEGDRNAKMAIQDPHRFVLKPQREGGGNNVFGDEIRSTLNQMSPNKRSQYILMDKIRPPSIKSYITRPELDKPVLTDVNSELGIYGVFISLGDKILVSREVGHLLRTKSSKIRETGIMSGTACYDSPYLF